MPRFYIDTYDHRTVIDGEGQELPDAAAARTLVQRSLIAIAAEEAATRSTSHIRADVRDETGRSIMKATVSVTVEWSAEAESSGSTLR